MTSNPLDFALKEYKVFNQQDKIESDIVMICIVDQQHKTKENLRLVIMLLVSFERK